MDYKYNIIYPKGKCTYYFNTLLRREKFKENYLYKRAENERKFLRFFKSNYDNPMFYDLLFYMDIIYKDFKIEFNGKLIKSSRNITFKSPEMEVIINE